MSKLLCNVLKISGWGKCLPPGCAPDVKQPFLCCYHFTVLFCLVLLGLYTLAYIVLKSKVMIRLFSTFSNNIGIGHFSTR